jgi:hypothetical protein
LNNNNYNKKRNMKRVILSIALGLAAPFAWAQVSQTTTTTTTTEGDGTITEYTPGSAIVLKETAGPRHYRFGKKVVYVTKSGKELDEDTVRTRVRVGVPVHVHYVGEGDDMMVDRVVLDTD